MLLKTLSKCTSLIGFTCDENQISSLNVTKNTKLENLACGGNQLKTLNVSKNTNLRSLHCRGNQLTKLDVKKLTALENFDFAPNQTSEIDLSKNVNLIRLWCGENLLGGINLSKDLKLEQLCCEWLPHADLSKHTLLSNILCTGSEVIAPDLSTWMGNNSSRTLEAVPVDSKGIHFPYTWKLSKGSIPSGVTISYSDKGVTFKGNVSSSGNAKKSERSSSESENNGKNSEKKDSVSVIYEYKPYVNTSLSSNGISESLTGLSVLSSDVLEIGSGKDSDLVTVKADQPLTFIIGEWKQEVYDEKVYVDDKVADDIDISKENTFTLPAEMIHDDFKVSVKAKAGDSELETEELYISAIE